MIPPWMSKGALKLVEPLHEIFRKYNKVLPKLVPGILSSLEDHKKKSF
jgi:hypothetical protein